MTQASPQEAEAGPRKISGKGFARAIALFAAAASLYHLITAGFGAPEAMIHRAIHLFFIFPLIFLLYPARKNSPRDRIQLIDAGGAVLSVLISLYIIWQYERLAWRMPYVDAMTPLDKFMAALAILLTLEVTRRTVGWALVSVAFLFIGYALLGNHLPGYLAIRGVSPALLLEQLYLLPEGILGTMTGLSATFVYLFILYGSFLKVSKAGDFFIDAALSMVGKARGGPAKVAIFASAFFGTMSGSAVANVFATGTFTIPLMISIGYRPFFAAAVEAAASTGGQIMPPVMGSAAFVMSDFTGIPYLDICIAALIPAILYFFCIYVMLDLRAVKRGLTGLPAEKIPSLRGTLRWGIHLVVPVFLLVLLLAFRYTPHYAAFFAIITTIGVCMARSRTRFGPAAFMTALKDGALNALPVAACLVCAGIVVGVTGLTGLGLKFTATIVYLSSGNLILALFIVSAVALLLGMGLPTPAAYLLVAIFGAPALVDLGVPKLLAHLFCFYYAILSAVTPPIAMAAYAGAAIGRCNFLQTGLNAMSLASIGYIVPFIFAFNSSLMLEGPIPSIVFSVFYSILGIIALAAGIQGTFAGPVSFWERSLLLAVSFLLFEPLWVGVTKPLGILAFLGFYYSRYYRMKRSRELLAEVGNGGTERQ
jgi:TRAP transporter 4TM/12TM fusion protein